jgi:methyltransferase
MTYIQAFTALILLVAIERIVELAVSKRNLAWSKANGGVEFSFGHYPFMVFLRD